MHYLLYLAKALGIPNIDGVVVVVVVVVIYLATSERRGIQHKELIYSAVFAYMFFKILFTLLR